MSKQQKSIIGRTAIAAFPAEGIRDIPVKIDTGADSSSIWASNLRIDSDGVLYFMLFGPESHFFSGRIHHTKLYTAKLVRSSNGSAQIRYNVMLSIELEGRKIRGRFTLADRSQNQYPVLIGCSLLNNKFVVDVSLKRDAIILKKKKRSYGLNSELKSNPSLFFEKYHIDNQRGDIDL